MPCCGTVTDVDTMQVAQGSFTLRRPHQSARSPLRAWDAADEYALGHIHELGVSGSNWLVVNDGFGALATALADRDPVSWGDSVVAHEAASSNRAANAQGAPPLRALRSTDAPSAPIDVAIIKIPKTLALLEDQLHRLRPALAADATVIGAGMVKAIHTSTLELFERVLGPSPTTLAKKKARLVLVEVDHTLRPPPAPVPVEYRGPTGTAVVNHANVFSQRRLDIGTRFLLDNLPDAVGAASIGDLGCGNGIVGTTLAVHNPEAHVTFTDVSYQAIASAQATFTNACGADRDARFLATDCLEGVEAGSLDLIVNNPPFHDGSSIGDDIAWRMFVQAKAALRPGGVLRVVGNRHLGYHTKLQKLFGNHTVVASNPKFVIIDATAPGGS